VDECRRLPDTLELGGEVAGRGDHGGVGGVLGRDDIEVVTPDAFSLHVIRLRRCRLRGVASER